MDKNEFETLHEKTKAIVETLDILENEIKEYQEKNVDIVTAIASLANISEQVASASKELSSAAVLFSSSDFSEALKEIDTRIVKINEAEVAFLDQSKSINSIVENVLVEYKNLSDDIKSVNENLREITRMRDTIDDTKGLLNAMVTKIDRIDRNTQKGFGKERG